MLKNIAIHQQSAAVVEENMSNLSSASNEASISSSNRNDGGNLFSPQYDFSAPAFNQTHHHHPHQSQPPKKKRNQPGHPDPDAEVIALSPRSLLATNRFVCEICSKGFQRDQNLQLHRRGHNLPWKLKQRANKEVVRKKVYVCPETSCVHHDPSRALGDLTGIKKHFCRKHGEKKWKCDKCSKRYAVQSDWKAHSKTCGTREYRCDCGTLFSRRDSFITHRAFCDALAEESAKNTTTTTTNNIIPLQYQTPQIQSQINNINPNQNHHHHHHHQLPLIFPIKKENNSFMMNLTAPDHSIPPWLPHLGSTPGPPVPLSSPSNNHIFQDFSQNPNPKTTAGLRPEPASSPFLPPPYPPPAPPHISATALLQKAAQMGAKSSTCTAPPQSPACGFIRPHHQPPPAHVSTGFGLNQSSRDGFINGLASYGNKAAAASGNATVTGGSITGAGAGGAGIITNPCANPNNHSYMFHDMMMGNPGTFDHDHGSAFEDMTFGGMLMSHTIVASKKEGIDGQDDQESLDFHAALDQFSRSRNDGTTNDGMTRDFLGLRALSQSDILSIAGLSSCMDSNNNDNNSNNNNNNACNDQH